MLLQDIHTSKPAKFNNHYLNSVTEDGNNLDGSQTSLGEILYLCLYDITNIVVKNGELVLTDWDRHILHLPKLIFKSQTLVELQFQQCTDCQKLMGMIHFQRIAGEVNKLQPPLTAVFLF